ncbi:hypothetical protein MVEN_01554900 [Mycena venus]|uniref:Uncharacterized protein n=1 Tax=Mycena venus TaxID=2733690 RepID=A0A8H7CPI9_9AGAR|nr:hypothetical protein MVEN_01554900 [Mycena venus]
MQQFPLTCTNEEPPAPVGLIDHRGLPRTPPYAYGWIVPYHELVDAAMEALGDLPESLQGPFTCLRWIDLGYGTKYGPGLRPQLKALHDSRNDGILVYVETNQSVNSIEKATSMQAYFG